MNKRYLALALAVCLALSACGGSGGGSSAVGSGDVSSSAVTSGAAGSGEEIRPGETPEEVPKTPETPDETPEETSNETPEETPDAKPEAPDTTPDTPAEPADETPASPLTDEAIAGSFQTAMETLAPTVELALWGGKRPEEPLLRRFAGPPGAEVRL